MLEVPTPDIRLGLPRCSSWSARYRLVVAARDSRVLEVSAEIRGDLARAEELELELDGVVVFHAREGTIRVSLELPCEGPLADAAREALARVESMLNEELLLVEVCAEVLIERDGKLLRRAEAERPTVSGLVRQTLGHLETLNRDTIA